MLPNAEYVQADLIGEINGFKKVIDSRPGVQFLTRKWIHVPLDKRVTTDFKRFID